MSAGYLVDTDWIIHWLNGHAAIGQRLEALRPQGLALSAISLAGLYEGVYYSREPEHNERQLRDALSGLTLLGVDFETCQIFGRERGRLRQRRTLIADFDLLIGATALRHQFTLLTNNRSDFEVLEGLQIESG